MRTKTLLLTAALGAAGIASSMAQVYSVNAVGYVNVSVPIVINPTEPTAATYTILANPLNGSTNNSLATILPSVPQDTKVYFFNGTGFDESTFDEGAGWIGADITLNPGDGFFLELPATAPNPTVITFVGEVPQGNLQNPLPVGFSLRGSQVPQAGTVSTQLLLPAVTDDNVYLFRNGGYISYLNLGEPSQWLPDDGSPPTEPTIGVAEGFWFQNATAEARSWNRVFSVN